MGMDNTAQTIFNELHKDSEKESINLDDFTQSEDGSVIIDEDLKDLRAAYIDPFKEYPLPPPLISLWQDETSFPLFTRGSISAIIGKAKGGKTALVSCIVAAFLVGIENSDGLAFTTTQKAGKVIFIDTEQGKEYGKKTIDRIAAIAGINNLSGLKYYDLRTHPPGRKLALAYRAIKEAGNVDLIIIDGIRDLTFDINEPKEASITVLAVMALSQEFQCHIINVLHQNKGDFNARGHLGTELINKSESVISINKDKAGDFSNVTPEYMRGISFSPFSITRNEDGIPICTPLINPPREKRKAWTASDIPLETQINIVSGIFKHQARLSYNSLLKEIILEYEKETGESLGQNKAKQAVIEFQAKRLIKKVKEANSRWPVYTKEDVLDLF